MANKKKKIDRRAFKKEGEELQQYLIFTRKGSRVESGKRYNRQKFKRGDREWLSAPGAVAPHRPNL
jgi:hypothetical protein